MKTKIAAHNKVFTSRENDEQQILLYVAASTLAFPSSNQEVCTCPSCSGTAALTGKRYKELPEQYIEGELIMDVEYLATAFMCKSCGLSFSTIEEVFHAGLPTHFTKTEATELHDLYEHDHQQEYDNM